MLYRLATGFSVATVVYHQSMTTLIAHSFHLSADSLWGLSVATQAGYGAGLILGLPLGDLVAPKRIIPSVMMLLGGTLLLIGLSPTLWLMVALCFFAGLLSIAGQMLLAYSAKVLVGTERAQVVGSLLTSLFAGLLLARVMGGFGGEYIGWRAIYLITGILTLLTGIGLSKRIDDVSLTGNLRYFQVLKLQGTIWRTHPELRRLSLVAASFFAASNGIWANLTFLMHDTLHWDAAHIGLLAFTSLAALRATWFTQYLQCRMSGPGIIILLALVMALTPLIGIWNGVSIGLLLIYLILADFCVRAIQAIAQSRVLDIDPPLASRINSLFMTVFFFGAAAGSWLGSIAIHHMGWRGMFLFTIACAAIGLFFLSWRNPELRLIRAKSS
ncbi:MFS transporter [Lonsdalea quercina]